jgi:hypothetical protein
MNHELFPAGHRILRCGLFIARREKMAVHRRYLEIVTEITDFNRPK